MFLDMLSLYTWRDTSEHSFLAQHHPTYTYSIVLSGKFLL